MNKDDVVEAARRMASYAAHEIMCGLPVDQFTEDDWQGLASAALAKLAPEPDYIELPSKPSDFNCVLGDVEAEIRGQLGDKFKHLAPIVAAEYRRQQALAEIRSALTIKELDHD